MEINSQSYIINQINEENDVEVKKKSFTIAQDIKSGRLSVVLFIEQLKDLLIHPSPSKRVLGVLILTDVLKNLPLDFLNDQQLKNVSVFYIEKLSDHHQVLPVVLRGILTLTEFKHFPGGIVPTLLNTLFHNVSCQQQQPTDRYTIYAIFKILLEKHEKEVVSMGLDFVYGIISSIDGERDPKNLLFLFKWLKTFLNTVSLGHLGEEMFELMACYFPVDFRAPPSISTNISREDLAIALGPCLCGIPEFAEYCIPLALEKLDSSLQIAKMDSLNLLVEGCHTFSVPSYIQYASEIWTQIQKEVFSGSDDKVKLKCLKTLTVIINKMSQSKEQGSFKSILKDISITTRGNLFPDSKLFVLSSDILFYTAVASQESAHFIVKEIVPLLTNVYSITPISDKKVMVLKSLTQFVKAYSSQYNQINLTEIEELQPITIFCLNALVETETNLIVAGFDSLSEMANSLPLNIRTSLYGNLRQKLIEPQNEEVRTAMLNCFKIMSLLYPDEIKDCVLYQTKINDPILLDLYLNALGVIASLNGFKHIVSDILLSYAVDHINLSTVAAKNIKNVLTTAPNNGSLLEIFVQKEIISRIVKYAVTEDVINQSCNNELLFHISSILKIVIGSRESEAQDKIASQQLNLINSCKEQSEEVYAFLLDGLLSRLHTHISVDLTTIEYLTRIAICHDNDLVKGVAAQLIANLINKQTNDEELNKWLIITKENCLHNINCHRSSTISTLAWITKALVMRNHFQGNVWTELLLDMLEQDSIVAKGFRTIMNDSCESLSSKSYCLQKLLYKQRFFVYVTNKLSTHYEPGKLSYLIAVGYLLENAPEQAILLQFRKILKLVILCLEQQNDPEVLCIILNRIKGFINNSEPIIQENLEDILLRILNLSAFEPSMKVRITALQCLAGLAASFPLYRILPFKQRILYQLALCIDDKKRLVRKEAVEARAAWFLVDAPI